MGYALQLTTARFIGTFCSDLTEIPYKIIERIATQINVDDSQNLYLCGRAIKPLSTA
ncbi:MAG: DUF4158 domain-containing protein [Legionella steelei]|nr:DUF4158 domain-containing protein [Legionella steelei]